MLKLRLVRHRLRFSVAENLGRKRRTRNVRKLGSLPSLMADRGRNSMTSIPNLQTLYSSFLLGMIVVSDTGLLCYFSLSAAL